MLNNKDINGILADQTGVVEVQLCRQSTVAYQALLSPDMAAMLASTSSVRRLTPFLATVVDVIASKLEVDEEALKLRTIDTTNTVQGWLADDQWAEIERDLWFAVVRDGRSYLLVRWSTEPEPGPLYEVVGAYNGYSGAGSMDSAGQGHAECTWNTWTVGKSQFFDIYYPDRIEKYVKEDSNGHMGSKSEWQPRQDAPDEPWPLPWVDDNGVPLGMSLIEFSIGCSDLSSSLQLGRDLNESMLDLLATSRTQGWPQRFLKGQRNSDLITNGLGQPIVSGHTGRPIRRQIQLTPGSVMLLGEGSELGQLPATKPDATLIDKLLELLSFVTTVPTHYFSGQWPSGIALIQAESRLNHKVEDHQGRLSRPTVALVRLLLSLSNYFSGTGFDAAQPLLIPWKSPVVETEDLVWERMKQLRENVVNLYIKGLMSLKVALAMLHPDWDEDKVMEELLVLQPAPTTAEVALIAADLKSAAGKEG